MPHVARSAIAFSAAESIFYRSNREGWLHARCGRATRNGSTSAPALDQPDAARARAVRRPGLGAGVPDRAGAVRALRPGPGTPAQAADRPGPTAAAPARALAAQPAGHRRRRQQLRRHRAARRRAQPCERDHSEVRRTCAGLRLDARPRVSGARQPTLLQRLADPTTRVLVCDPADAFEPQAVLSTDQATDPIAIPPLFVRRCSVEATFARVRRHLGVKTKRHREAIRPEGRLPGVGPRHRPHHTLPARPALARGRLGQQLDRTRPRPAQARRLGQSLRSASPMRSPPSTASFGSHRHFQRRRTPRPWQRSHAHCSTTPPKPHAAQPEKAKVEVSIPD